MAFGQELQDFAAGFKIGRGVVEDKLDRKERKENREADQKWREEGRAIDESHFNTNLERLRERDAKSDARDEKIDKRYDENQTHQRFREGIQDERYFNNEADQSEQRRRANDLDERRLDILEKKTLYPEGQIQVDPSTVPQGSGAIPDGDQTSSLYTPDWLEYANQSATRRQPLAPQLVSALDKVAPALGVKVKVFSGGQPSSGPGRTGSHRHDDGGAGDIFLEKDGRQLSWENPRDRPIFEQFAKLSAQAGLTGFGAGEGYMQPGSMHVGFGKKATWGAGGDGANAAGWLKTAVGYADGGMVKSFALGGAIDDGEPEYEPTRIPIASLLGGGQEQPQQEQPQQVAEAIPTNVPTPTPRPEYGGAGVVTSQGNEPTPADEPATDDPYELGRRSVRDGLKRAIQQSGANEGGAIADPQSDAAHKKYLTGYGAAPRTLVQQAVQAVDPDKKMRPGERNLAAMGQVYKHYMDAGEPEKAVAAASSMVQYYRQESNRFLALSQAAAQKGDLDNAAKAAVAAYTNIPNGRDLKITPKDGGYEIKVTNEDGKVINTKVVNPQEFAAAAIGFNPATFDEEILNAAGEKAEKFDDITPDNRSKVDEAVGGLVDQLQDPKIIGNPNMLSTVKNLAGDIASVTQNKTSNEQAVKIAVAMSAADPKDVQIKSIRGNPDRVRVTVDGQSVVMTKNAIADFAKTSDLSRADQAKKDEEAKKPGYAGAAADLAKKAVGAFMTPDASDDPAVADTPNAARWRTRAATPEAVPTEAAPAAPQDINTMDTPGAARIRTRAATPELAIPQDAPVTSVGNVNSMDTPGAARIRARTGAPIPTEGVAIPDGGPQQSFKGQIEKGNIDLNQRPVAKNADGSISTVRSITITDDSGQAILIPTVSPSGVVLSNEAAIQLYKQTGQHLGTFDNEKDAEAYAQALHQSQARRYAQ